VLYSFNRAKDLAKEQESILTEGFLDVMKLWQAGFKNVVAMCSLMSKQSYFWKLWFQTANPA